jgi:hypothetical protein
MGACVLSQLETLHLLHHRPSDMAATTGHSYRCVANLLLLLLLLLLVHLLLLRVVTLSR